MADGPLGGRWSGRGGILCRGFPTGCSPASTAVEHAASFNLRPATGAFMVTGRNMLEKSDGGQLTDGNSGGQGTTPVASTRRGLCGGWYGGHEGILCRGFPTGQPPALDRSRTDASGAAAIVALRNTCDGGQYAISRTVMAGGSHGGRLGGHEGILCRGFPTGRSPAPTGPAGCGAAMVVYTTEEGATTVVGSNTAVGHATWFNLLPALEVSTVIWRNIGGQLTMSTTPAGGGSWGGGLGGHGGILCRGFPTGRPPALDGRTHRAADGTWPLSGKVCAMGGSEEIARVSLRNAYSGG